MQLSHERRGSGAPVVVLQHFAGPEMWEPVVERLSREREVWSVDLPGFGGSPLRPMRTLAMAEVAGAVGEWFGETGLDAPHVVGVSYAGAVALELARAGTVGAATAISPLGFWTRTEAAIAMTSVGLLIASARAPWAGLVMGSRIGPRLAAVQLVAHASRVPPDALAAMTKAAATNRLVFHPDLVPGIASYRAEPFVSAAELTIAWGDRDRITPPAQARRAERLFPAALHVTLTGCGHVPMFDDPEQVAQAVLEGGGSGSSDPTSPGT